MPGFGGLPVGVGGGGGGGSSVTQGTFASRPAAGTAGRTYISQDINLVSYDNGSAWVDYVPGQGGVLTIPPSAGWTTSPLGASSIVTSGNDRVLAMAASGGGDFLRLEYRTLTAAINYTATFFIEQNMSWAGNHFFGPFLRDAAGLLIHFNAGIGNPSMKVTKWSAGSPATFVADYHSQTLSTAGYPKWWRIRDDGTLRHFEYSMNGTEWVDFFNVGRTDYMTPNAIGWGGLYSQGIVATTFLRLRSFKES